MTATPVTEHRAPTGCAHDTVGHDSVGKDEFSTGISRPVGDDARASARDNNLRWHFRPVPPAGPVVSHSDENTEERTETTYRVHTLTYAARAIRRYRTTVVTCGTPGIVVDVHSAPRTYTVEFQPTGLAGATIRVPALTDADLAHDPP
jgi:hypothetical protein